jgi:hypothetical protein
VKSGLFRSAYHSPGWKKTPEREGRNPSPRKMRKRIGLLMCVPLVSYSQQELAQRVKPYDVLVACSSDVYEPL